MSLYWMYVGDQCSPLLPTLNQQIISPDAKLTDSLSNQIFLQNKLINPFALSSPPASLQDLKLNWAFLPGLLDKPDTSKHFHIFVGDLCPNLDLQSLQEAFSQYGQVSDCKIIQDPQTLKSRGYGFVSFVKKDDAEKAIKEMNGQYIGSRAIRTNWAIRKGSSHLDGGRSFNYEDILSQPASINCTVYCGGIMTNLTEDAIRKTFELFGEIVEIRIFQEKGYAFIKFTNKEDAARAIIETHLTEVAGHIVKCAWGKKAEDQIPGPAFIPAFAHILPTQLLRPAAIPPPLPLAPQAAVPSAATAISPLTAVPSAYTILNQQQQQQQQCYSGIPLSLPPAALSIPVTSGTGSAAVPPIPYDYYLYPTTATPAAAAADMAFQKSLEANLAQQMLQHQQQQQQQHHHQQQQHASLFGSPLHVQPTILSNVTALSHQPHTVNFSNPGVVYSVP